MSVKVVTAASGSYDNTLSAQMNKTVCPTLFNCSNAQSVENWHDYCYDLKGSMIYDLLESDDYCLYDSDGRLCSIGYCYEAFGIITNKTLLEKSGHSVEEIVNFDTLKADCFGTTPFKDHLPGTNGFLNEAERLMNDGKYTIT